MGTKTGHRNLRHARIGEQSASGRSPFTKDRIATRLLCVEFNLPGGDHEGQQQEPVELFFKPIPASVVMKLQSLGKGGNSQETIFSFMLDILAKYVVDPQTGQSVATSEEWDQFGIDGIQAAIQAMVDGSRGGGGGEGQGPTSAASTEAMYQAAKEMMQGDPEMAAAFRKAAEETSQMPDEPSAQTGDPETELDLRGELRSIIDIANEEDQKLAILTPTPTPTPAELPNGTSDETP